MAFRSINCRTTHVRLHPTIAQMWPSREEEGYVLLLQLLCPRIMVGLRYNKFRRNCQGKHGRVWHESRRNGVQQFEAQVWPTSMDQCVVSVTCQSEIHGIVCIFISFMVFSTNCLVMAKCNGRNMSLWNIFTFTFIHVQAIHSRHPVGHEI